MKRFIPLIALATLACPFAYAGHGDHGGDRHFDKMDTNGDGQISAVEHAATVDSMFQKMDLNKDGSTDAAEMATAHEQMREDKIASRRAEKVAKMDANGDGTVSAAEHSGYAQAKFAQMDTNKDGNLSKAEMEAAHAMKRDDRK
jgi:Ca2+-binding EF-hand superfamily protein